MGENIRKCALPQRHRSTTSRRQPLHGFTLVELLVVIAIIALLLSIMMPALSKVRESSKRLMCSTNMRQIAVAMIAYESEFRMFPTQFRSNSLSSLSYVKLGQAAAAKDQSSNPSEPAGKYLVVKGDAQNEGHFYTWMDILCSGKYLSLKVLNCPNNGKSLMNGNIYTAGKMYPSYGLSAMVSPVARLTSEALWNYPQTDRPISLGTVRNVSGKILLAELNHIYALDVVPYYYIPRYTYGGWLTDLGYTRRHSGLTQFSFLDGHTEAFDPYKKTQYWMGGYYNWHWNLYAETIPH